MNRGKFRGNLWGIVFVAIGVIIAGNVLDWWHFSIFFRGWWTLLIIIPCAQSVMRRGFHNGAGLGLIFGILMFLSQQHLFSFGWIIKLAVPGLLIYYGLKVVMQDKAGRRESGAARDHGHADNDFDCNAIFSGIDRRVDGEEYFGSDVNAVFGGVTLDLRGAMVVEDVEIHANAVFGGVDIFVPQDVNVKVKATSLFGGTDNKVTRAFVPEWPTIYIYSTSLFGGVEIK